MTSASALAITASSMRWTMPKISYSSPGSRTAATFTNTDSANLRVRVMETVSLPAQKRVLIAPYRHGVGLASAGSGGRGDARRRVKIMALVEVVDEAGIGRLPFQ